MKIDILGTEYEIFKDISFDKDPCLEDRFAYIDYNERKIVIGDLKTLKGWKDSTDKAIERQNKESLRHEIVHGFLRESGLTASSLQYDAGWAGNEEMVDWFAMQAPKIYKTFEEAGCL